MGHCVSFLTKQNIKRAATETRQNTKTHCKQNRYSNFSIGIFLLTMRFCDVMIVKDEIHRNDFKLCCCHLVKIKNFVLT